MSLTGKQVLLFAGPDFEDRELFYPYYRFKEEGATVKVAGLGAPEYLGKCGVPMPVNGRYEDFVSQKWDVIVIPGGWAPDKIRMNVAALDIVRQTLKQNAIVASICHGGWVLTSADVVRNRKATSFLAIRDDMVHAGAQWVDEEVVVDQTGPGIIITSRKPDDIPAFCRAILTNLTKSV